MVKMLRSWHDFIPISGLVLLTSTIWKGVSTALFFVLTVILHTPMSGITLPPYVCKIALLFRIGGLFLILLRIGNGMTLKGKGKNIFSDKKLTLCENKRSVTMGDCV